MLIGSGNDVLAVDVSEMTGKEKARCRGIVDVSRLCAGLPG